MIKNNDIHETINQILFGLKEKGMTESSITSGYRGVYSTFLEYLDENKICEISEEVCIHLTVKSYMTQLSHTIPDVA